MRNSKNWIAATSAMLLISMLAPLVRAQSASVSPNGFIGPNCTWSADIIASWLGWDLEFSTTTGRHARTWTRKVSNAKVLGGPVAWSIMVLNSSVDGKVPEGHVGWVLLTNSSGSAFLVLHSNHPGGDLIGAIDGWPIRLAVWEYVPNSPGRVRVVGGRQQWPVMGFLIPD